MAESSDLSGEPRSNLTLDNSSEPGLPQGGSESPEMQRSATLSRDPGTNGPDNSGVPPHHASPGRSLRSFKKSVERAISRATGELQAYSEAFSTLLQDGHVKTLDLEDWGNEAPLTAPVDTVEPVDTVAEAPAQEPAETSVPTPNETAGDALRRLVRKSKTGRKSRVVDVGSEAVSKLIVDAAKSAQSTDQARAHSGHEEAQAQQSQQWAQPQVDIPPVPPAASSQPVLPAGQYMQPPPPPQPREESVVRQVQAPVVDVTPVPGTGSGFHNLMSRAGRAVRRTTGEVHVYTDALSKMIHERARHGPPDSAQPSSAAAPPQAPPAPQESGLQGFVGRAMRRTTGEVAALRSQLSQLVEEARLKENVKSQERIESLQTTERLPVAEQMETSKYASLCPSQWKDLSGGDQYRHCNQCGLFIYDFKDKSLSVVEKIVFQREGVSNPTFYQRQDGRFLIRDCPVGLRKRQQRILALGLVSVGTMGVLAYAFLVPHPQPAPVPEVVTEQPKKKPRKAARTREPVPDQPPSVIANPEEIPGGGAPEIPPEPEPGGGTASPPAIAPEPLQHEDINKRVAPSQPLDPQAPVY